jgi:ATP-dependent Clp protease ATP-binding subunit ClpA
MEDKKMPIAFTERSKKYLADEGFDEVYGARPLKRVTFSCN